MEFPFNNAHAGLSLGALNLDFGYSYTVLSVAGHAGDGNPLFCFRSFPARGKRKTAVVIDFSLDLPIRPREVFLFGRKTGPVHLL